MTVVDQILARWPLRAMCTRLKIELPERDGAKFSSPFRRDRNPSCSIIHGKMRHWSTGENLDPCGRRFESPVIWPV